MPRVHYVKKSRKANPAVAKGQPYYWWKFRFGPKIYSKTRPKRSQLTRSWFLSAMYSLEDNMGGEMTEGDVDELAMELEGLLDECQTNLDNMPDALQDTSESGMLLQERIDSLEDWIEELASTSLGELTPEQVAEFVQDTNPGW